MPDVSFLDRHSSMRSAIRTTAGATGHSPHRQCAGSILEPAAEELYLEQALYQELRDKFLVLRVDAATGISFYDTADEQELPKVCQLAEHIASKGQKLGDVEQQMAQTQHQPLPMLILLRAMSNAVTRLGRRQEPVQAAWPHHAVCWLAISGRRFRSTL